MSKKYVSDTGVGSSACEADDNTPKTAKLYASTTGYEILIGKAGAYIRPLEYHVGTLHITRDGVADILLRIMAPELVNKITPEEVQAAIAKLQKSKM